MRRPPIGYDAVQELARELDRPVHTLFALSIQNDPHYVGMPAQVRDAHWFADLWRRFGFGAGTHLRRVHYRLISQEVPVRRIEGRADADGCTDYTNTLECWSELNKSAKWARYLGLVSIDDFVDRRAPAPHLHADTGEAGDIYAFGYSIRGLDLPRDLATPRLEFDPPRSAQPYLIEVWIEKSTVNDEVLPVCERYGVNLCTFQGEVSLSACRDLVNRAREDGRPVRILYISDFDPGGRSMPVAAARKIEWLVATTTPPGEDPPDIQLRHILLTQQQCIDYELPRTPIKEGERRAANFEERFGEGATELDALVAIHPGELEKILRAELDRYFDHGLARRGERAARELRAELDRIEADVLAGHADEVGAIRARYAEVLAEIDAIHADAKPLWQAITTALNDAAPDVEDLDWPEPRAGDEDPDPLFDSTRDYVDQIEAYKRFQGQPTERRERIAGGVRGLVKRRKEERQRRLLKNGGGDGEGGS